VAVLAAGWVNGGGGAAVVAVTSVIEAALLAQARAPRLVAAIAAPFLGLAAIVPTTLAAMTPVAGQSGGTIVSHYARALVTGLASTQDWDFTVGLCAVLFLCGYWLGWTALREHRGVLAVIPVFSVLATNVVNAKDPDPIAVPETVAVVLALAVIAAAHLGALSERWASARITPLHGMRVRFGASAAAVAVGARKPLIAFNINLATDDLADAQDMLENVVDYHVIEKRIRAIIAEGHVPAGGNPGRTHRRRLLSRMPGCAPCGCGWKSSRP